MTRQTITNHRPSECPACGAAVKLASDKRTQFECYALAVRLDAPEAWMLREPCTLPPRRSDVGEGGGASAVQLHAAPRAAAADGARPRQVVAALVGNIRDWAGLRRRHRGEALVLDVIEAERRGGRRGSVLTLTSP